MMLVLKIAIIGGIRLVPAFALVLAFLVGPSAQAAGTTGRVLQLLQGYEWRDNASGFLALGEGVDLVLMGIADDPRWHNVIRFRALAALRHYPDPRVARYLENFVGQRPSPDMLRRAVAVYAQAFGQSHPQQVAVMAEALLEHDDPHTRIQAARALRGLPRDAVSLQLRHKLDSGALENGVQ